MLVIGPATQLPALRRAIARQAPEAAITCTSSLLDVMLSLNGRPTDLIVIDMAVDRYLAPAMVRHLARVAPGLAVHRFDPGSQEGEAERSWGALDVEIRRWIQEHRPVAAAPDASRATNRPASVHEAALQAALESLDTPGGMPDRVLDGLVRVAAALIGCPTSLVSLVGRERQWFKARTGWKADQSPRDVAFCAETVLQDDILEVTDARLDDRFRDNPFVIGEPHVRFYAGVPLEVDGVRIGALCVIDTKPRRLSETQRSLLRDLAVAAENRIVAWQQQSRLSETETYRRALVEQLGDGVLLFDRDHRIVDANPQALTMLGHDAETLLGTDVSELVCGSDRDTIAAAMDAQCDGGSTLCEWQCVRRDGSTFAAEVSARRMTGGRRVAVLRDVSARRAKDQQLLHLTMAVEQCAESIAVFDEHDRLEYVNQRFVVDSGFARDELVGRNVRELHSDLMPAEYYEAVRAALDAGNPWKGLIPSRRKDGSTYSVYATVTPVRGHDGHLSRFVTVREDVTEKLRMSDELDQHRHHLEDLVRQRTAELAAAKQAAEAASAAKSTFLATMSHEIRTPMNGVIGLVDVMRQSSLTPYQSDLADTMRESAFALLRIIDDILDFSKIEAGRFTVEDEPVALRRLVEGVCESLRPVALARDVCIHIFVDPRLPAWIIGDTVRLRQILNNLLSNAIKFSSGLDRRGMVGMRVESPDPATLRIEVDDNGIGLPDEARERIFRPFEQAEGSTTRRYGGTGLGLPICQRLVDLMGGSIAVDSVPGAGASFVVTLPLRPTTGDPNEAALPDLSGLDCRVLVAGSRRARDLCAYLAAAGAAATVLPDLDALRSQLAANPPVTVVFVADEDAIGETLSATATGDTGERFATVIIGRGRRHRPRLIRPGHASIDADALQHGALLKAVALATGRWRPEAETSAQPGLALGGASVPDVDAAAAAGTLVLVAEDNDINQKVIGRQLALLGLAAEFAADGREALARWRTGRYGLILTDLHMPEMDGYELAATIRREEAAGTRLPIIALTANVLSEERSRCKAVGMDDCLTKPVRLEQLAASVGQCLALTPPRSASAAPTDDRPPTASTGFDDRMLEQVIGGDPALLSEIWTSFQEAARVTRSELRAAVASGALESVRDIAHRFKSAARSVGAVALGDSCEGLEGAAAAADSDAVVELHARFERELARAVGRARVAVESPSSRMPAWILLVDDDPLHLQVVEKQLAALGLSDVRSAGSGEEALSWLRGRPTAGTLVLLDLNMPRMDGVEFMRHLVEQGFAGALALISGADKRALETAAKLAQAHRLTVLRHVEKPASSERLVAMIDQWRNLVPIGARRAERAYSAREIERAIESHALELHYQPKVAMTSGSIVGVEALVRWRHPTDGLIPPDAFVPAAEAHGLIDALTRAVLTLALTQSGRWRDHGNPLPVAVNITMENLARLDFSELVLEALSGHDLPFGDLTLEVTESRLTQDVRLPMDALTRLRLKGVELSIDDFGTGHSSLAQLRDFPFSELKIDRSFVHGAHAQTTQRAIVAASVEMAHQLGMRVVAEGVEDRADWDFAKLVGCDLVQGYFVGRPMPADALPAWARQWSERVETLA